MTAAGVTVLVVLAVAFVGIIMWGIRTENRKE